MKGRIPPELLQKIKESVSIIDVVSEVVVLRKAGSNYTGLCPFHAERSPSFSVSEQKQLYHCYGCQAGGDIIKFITELHGLSFMDAIEDLADRGKVKLPTNWDTPDGKEDPEVAKRRAAAREKMAKAEKLNRFVLTFYQNSLALKPQKHIADYFQRRGVHGDVARSFYVGAAPGGWDALTKHLIAAKAPLEIATELGLIRPSQKGANPGGPGYFDLFRDRAMFPIIDMRKKVVGFGGRSMSDDKDLGPKYLNSAGSFLYYKDKVAFGLFQAARHIREKDELILVEGYFDVLALHAAGFQNAVATCGTALTSEHLQLFQRLASKITVLFDNDKGGVSGTERAMEVGLDHGLVLHGASLPPGLDPDELLFNQDTGEALKDGAEKMRAVLAASQPLLDERIAREAEAALGGSEARTQSLKKVAAWLARFKDPIGRDVRMQEAATRLKVSPELLSKAMGSSAQPRSSQPVSASNSSSNASGGIPVPRGGPVAPRPPAPSREQPSKQQQQSYQSGPPAEYDGPPMDGPQSFNNNGNGPPQSGSSSRHSSRGPSVRPAARPAKAPKLSEREKIVLTAMARGGKFSEMIAQFRGHLPPAVTISDLFEYPPAREFVSRLFQEPGFYERFRATPENILAEDLDAQVRATLTEAWVAAESPYEDSEVKHALGRSVNKALERFSQRINIELADAEARKDAELEANLKKDYLDVQKKMKELSSFYDEA